MTQTGQPIQPAFWIEGADFAKGFAALLAERRQEKTGIAADVAAIFARVRAEGDAALAAAAQKYDGVDLAADAIRLSDTARREAAARCTQDDYDALNLAAARISAFHQKQKPETLRFCDEDGVEQGQVWRPVASAGLYIPGGKASYPSSVLMGAIPAKIAGVAKLVAATPARTEPDSLVMAAADLAGISDIYQAGGAYAIAALGYGTKTIAPVAVITGPGNQWVAEAKRQIYGRAGIDMIAGPSEVLVIADKNNNPLWLAADLLSQAEHDENAQSILLTDDKELAARVLEAMAGLLAGLASAPVAAASWQKRGAVIIVPDLTNAAALANELAAEHVEIALAEPDALAAEIHHAGALFLGAYTAEAIGDYVGGPNHVLPTGGAARFASGLSVMDFMLRTSILRVPRQALARLGPAAIHLARREGLPAHAKAVALRMETP